MPRGGYRPGSGRPKAGQSKGKLLPPLGIKRSVIDSGMTPLEYMLEVMRNPKVEEARRDRMAVAAAPYVHEKKVAADTRVGKKEQALIEARKPDVTTSIGALIAHRHGLAKGEEHVN